MNKKELINAVAEVMGTTKKAAGEAVDAVFGVIADAMAEGNDVAVSGFGKFVVAERAERQGRNPLTGESITIAASKAPKFKASSALQDAVNS